MTRKILLVDDSPVARKILRMCLADEKGYEVHEACDGLEGVKKYGELRPDITLMDLTMPGMNGLEAMAEIKKLREDALVIVQTADVQVKSVCMAMENGAFMVLKKPMTKETVHEAIMKADEELRSAGQ